MLRYWYRHISDEGAATMLFEEWRWPWGNPRTCPHCGSSDTGPFADTSRPYRCHTCLEFFSVRTRTRYDDGRPLWEWWLRVHFEYAEQKGLSDEQAVTALFEGFRWGAFPICPHCQSLEVSVVSSGKPMPYHCRDCRKYFSVRTATIFERSKVPLHKWLKVICLYGRGEDITSVELARAIGVTQRTAWRLQQVCSKAFTQ